MSTFWKLFGVVLAVFLLTLLTVPAFAETETVCAEGDGVDCPEPIQVPCGVADVDGVIGEWTEADFIADMFRAGDPTKPVESKLYLRYDAQTDTLYVMVKTVAGVSVVASAEDAYVKVVELSTAPQVDGNSGDDGSPPDFQWTGTGFEASLILTEGIWTLNVHLQVFDDGANQTSAVAHRALRVKLGPCQVPDPASLIIEKTLVNDDSGTLVVSDFVFYINGKEADAGVKYEVPAGNYALTEQPEEGYTASEWGGDCKPDGTITLAAGQQAVCTIVNDDDEDEGTIHVYKFYDKNGDGIPQPEEVRLDGWTFQLKTLDGQTVLQEAKTDDNGHVTFVVLFGQYLVCEVVQPGWAPTTRPCQRVEVTSKVGSVEVWFGNRYTKGDAIVIKFYDKNKSGGEPEQGEPVLPGFEIILYQNLVEVGRATTDAEGKVVFKDIPEGNYTACEVLQNGWLPVNLCVDLTVEGGKAVTGYIRNYKEPTAEGVEAQPGRPHGFQVLLPSLSRD